MYIYFLQAETLKLKHFKLSDSFNDFSQDEEFPNMWKNNFFYIYIYISVDNEIIVKKYLCYLV